MIKSYLNNHIHIWDNALTLEDFNYVCNYCETNEIKKRETDSEGLPVIGTSRDIHPSEKIFQIIEKSIIQLPFIRNCVCDRAYINKFSQNETPLYHNDKTEWTVLFYPNKEWNINSGGETKFFIDGSLVSNDRNDILPLIFSIPPLPNRLLFFKGNMLHTASSFNNDYRFSIAFKYLNQINKTYCI